MSDLLDITLKACASQNSEKFGYLDFTDGGNTPDIESSSDRVNFALGLGFPFLIQADTFWETVTLYAFPSLRDAKLALAKLSPRCYVSEVMQFSPIA